MQLDINEQNILNQIKLKGSQGMNKNALKKTLNLSQGIITNCLKELIKEGLV